MSKSTATRKPLRDFTKGPIIPNLITLSVPIVLANVLQTAYQLIDTFWVGRLGANAVAAVSLSFPLLFLMISLAGGLGIAGTIMVAQYKGQGNTAQVDYVSAQTLIMMTLSALTVSIIGYLLTPSLMSLMGAEPAVLPDAVSYLQVSFAGLIFMFGFFVYQSLMRGVGDVKTPFYIVGVTVLLNLIFDPLFILGWGPIPAYGVTGAAIATIGTQAIATIIGMIMLFNGKHGIHLRRENFTIDLPLVKKMFMLGLPASVSQSARAAGLVLMTFLVASFGTITIASYGIGTRILSFIIIPAVGVSMATSTLVGQNVGAGKVERANDITMASLKISFGFLTAIGILVFLLAEPLAALFIKNDPAVVSSASYFVQIMALTFGFIGVQQTLNGTFQGAGDTKATMIVSLLSLFAIQFPLAYVLSKHTALGADGVYWAFPFSNIITALIMIIWYRTGSWKEKAVVEKPLHAKVMNETIVEEGIQ